MNLTRPMECQYCKHGTFRTVRRLAGDGHTQIYRKCDRCGQFWQAGFIKKDKVIESQLPWDAPLPAKTCERCGKQYAQTHHYYPQSIARRTGEDANSWPMQDLCNECHGKWHTGVTPGLVKKEW